MRFCKRLIGVLTALVLAAALLPTAFARQYYSRTITDGTSEEVAAMLDRISEQNFVNTDAETVREYIEHFLYRSDFAAVNSGRFRYTNAQGYWAGKSIQDGTYYQVVSGTGCFAYSKFVSLVIYGTSGVLRDEGQTPGCFTGSAMKAFLDRYAQAGEHIRIDYRHSVTYISGTEEGFYFMDYAGDAKQRIALCYTTYDNFAAKCNELYVRVLLFDANLAENGEEPGIRSMSSEEYDWLSSYADAVERSGLITTDISSDLSLTETALLAAQARSLINGVQTVTDTESFWENLTRYKALNMDLNSIATNINARSLPAGDIMTLDTMSNPILQMFFVRSVFAES